MEKLKNLPMILKILLAVFIFIVVFVIINDFIVTESSDTIREAKNEQGIWIASVFIAFSLYMALFYKVKTSDDV